MKEPFYGAWMTGGDFRHPTGRDFREARVLPRRHLAEIRDRLERQAASARLTGQHDYVGRIALEKARQSRADRIEGTLHVDVDHLFELIVG